MIIGFLSFIFFIAVGQQLYKLYFVFLQNNFVDFNVYLNSVLLALTQGDVYAPLKTTVQAIPFNYPPTSLIFFLGLTIFPKTITLFVFVLFSIASLLITVWLLTQILFIRSKKLYAFLLFSICFIQYFPTKFTLTLGQINLMILLLVTAVYYLFRKNKELLSGFILGIATVIKIFPIFLIFFFIKEKKWKTIISFTSTLLCCLLLTVLLFKPVLVYSYFGLIGKNLFLNAGDISYFDQSLNSFLLRLHFTFMIRLIFRVIITGTSLFVFLKTKDKMLSFFGLIFSVLIFLPSFAWFHHYVILIPLIIMLWSKTRPGMEKVLLVCIYVLTSLHFRNPELFPGPNIWLYSHPFFGACLLWFFAVKKALDK